jgi:transcriptional regulator with XRE-family HTH domain
MGRRSNPNKVRVWYRGIEHELDLKECRRALVNRQVAGEFDSMESLADKLEMSRSTASRFFSGKSTPLAVTLKIVGALRLRFEDVAKPVDDEDEPGGAATAEGRRKRWTVPERNRSLRLDGGLAQ